MSKSFLRTDLLFLGRGEPLKNGMLVLDEKGKVLEVGVSLNVSEEQVDYYKGALCPGFVNTHCHLELSHLKDKVRRQTGLNGFIEALQALREADEEVISKAIEKADIEMQQAGIVAVGDICNSDASFACKSHSTLLYHSFIELFAFDPAKAEFVFTRGIDLKNKAQQDGLLASVVPHSPYSVSEKLFQKVAFAADNSPLSIHNQETEAENEMYQKASGKMMDMLVSFGNKVTNFRARGQNSLPSYLPQLPKQKSLLLVHNTYTNAADLEQAEALHKQLYWCFCPNANLYIEGQLPSFHEFIKADVKGTLGTDSLASNGQLSILEEMKTIQAAEGKISLNKLIEWGCVNGAEFLGMDQLGSFEKGKKPAVNWIKNLDHSGALTKDSEVVRII